MMRNSIIYNKVYYDFWSKVLDYGDRVRNGFSQSGCNSVLLIRKDFVILYSLRHSEAYV